VLDLEQYVPALVTLLENKLTNTASVIYRQTFGIGATEMRIVVLLGSRSKISGNQIGQAIGLDKAAVSRALKSLEAVGLITIEPGYGRRRQMMLTAAGRKVHDRGVIISLRREECLLTNFTRAEHKALVGFLNRMLAQMPAVSAICGEIEATTASRKKTRAGAPGS
jgi:DNA-binding MarR family transcriptional regulator